MADVARLEDDPGAELAAHPPPPRRAGFDFDAHEWGVLLPLSLVGLLPELRHRAADPGRAGPRRRPGGQRRHLRHRRRDHPRRCARPASAPSASPTGWGRRRMLLVSVIGVHRSPPGSRRWRGAWSPSSPSSSCSRVFLATEETLSGVVLTEELRPDRRGAGIGLLGHHLDDRLRSRRPAPARSSTPRRWAGASSTSSPSSRSPSSCTCGATCGRRGPSTWPRPPNACSRSWWPRLAAPGPVAAVAPHRRHRLRRDARHDGVLLRLRARPGHLRLGRASSPIVVIAAGPATLLGYRVGGHVERPRRPQAGHRRLRPAVRGAGASCSSPSCAGCSPRRSS